ncbi:MAG: ABC transporter ATP-binding protein [Haloferacaceae archaeon]
MSLEASIRARFTADGADPFTVDAEIAVDEGETLVVLGPSGSGKTLLLESVAGFHPSTGRVELDGRAVDGLPPERRGFGFVFQDYALFPHMTVRENVAFGEPYHEAFRDPDEMLAELGVSHLADRRPRTLSGGEQQRVALARSLAVNPDALLLDEPLSALDVPTRQSLRDDLVDAIADVTSVYVTHDRTTARAVADRIAVMNDGEIVQVGDPEEVFESPASAFVARFVGANCVALDGLPRSPAVDGATHAAIRPEHVALTEEDPDLRLTVERVTREEAAFRVECAVDGDESIHAFTNDPPREGDRVGLRLPAERLTPLS